MSDFNWHENEINRLRYANEDLEREVANLNSALRDKEYECDRLERDSEQKEYDNHTLRGRVHDLEAQVCELDDELYNYQSE